MRLRFLGTGTSSGVPVIGCGCRVCGSDDPKDTRLRTGAALEFTDPGGQERVILLDAGPDLRQQVLASGLERCDAVLLTHNHVDHCFGLDELRRFNVMMGVPIPIYADTPTMRAVRRVYAHIFDRASLKQDSFIATLIPVEIGHYEPFELFGLCAYYYYVEMNQLKKGLTSRGEVYLEVAILLMVIVVLNKLSLKIYTMMELGW